MKIVLNCLVRNEMPHMSSAMAHFTTLFDEVHVVDHLSDDGTREALGNWNSEDCAVHIYHFDNPGYFQSELMTFLAREQAERTDVDWIFFLDFDEYLPFQTRQEFEQALLQHRFDSVIKMRWHNLIPKSFGNAHHLGAEYLVPPFASDYVKIAVQPKRLPNRDRFIVEQGNHSLRLAPGRDPVEAEFAFGVFHIPIDSEDQLRAKIATGVEAYAPHWQAGNSELGKHWVLMGEALDTGADKDALLRRFISRYGEEEELARLASDSLIDGDGTEETLFRHIRLDLAGHISDGPAEPNGKASPAPRVLHLANNGVVTAETDVGAPHDLPSFRPEDGLKAGPLPDENAFLVGVEPPQGLDAFLSRSLDKIKSVTPSAWGGHIPFMFALIETLRPRRYAELGSHYGASFFAACQTAQKIRIPADFVAIDLWEGDPQAGYYGEEVYDAFERIRLKHYASVGRSIRSYFVDAAPHFEDKSLDLIHIDGLHTYEAVKEDYETWRPKLTDNGVIIFHDTNEYQTDFGVWDFFSRVRHEGTASFAFKHTHGLGVMAFGDPARNPMIGVLDMMNADPIKTERHFARQGEMLVAEARFDAQMAAQNNAAQNNAAGKDRRIGRAQITDEDLLNTRTKVLFKMILRRFKLRQKKKRLERQSVNR